MTYFDTAITVLPATPQEQLALLFERCAFLLRDVGKKYERKDYEAYATTFARIIDTMVRLPALLIETHSPHTTMWIHYFETVQYLLNKIALTHDEKKVEILTHNFRQMAQRWRKVEFILATENTNLA